MNAVWQNPPVDGRRLLLLLALADNCSDEGMCYPGIRYLAHKTCQSERNVQYGLRYLENRGLIRAAPDEQGFTRYFLNMEVLQGGASFAPGGAQGLVKTRARLCTTPVQGLVKNGVSSFIEPSLEPSLKTTVIETDVFNIAKANGRIRNPSCLGQALQVAICEAIDRDGPDVVLAGTKNFTEAIAKWRKSELRYAPNPVKFYSESHYLTDPAEWDRSGKDKYAESKETVSRILEELYPEDDSDPEGHVQ
jgi:hypothetical protein